MKRMNWKTAKTYADAPHEYVLANEHPETYRRFSQLLKQAGVMESFTLRGKTAKYRYYYAGDGYKYWIIGRVLNRCVAQAPPT